MASKRLVPDTLAAMGMPSPAEPRAETVEDDVKEPIETASTDMDALVKNLTEKLTETLIESLSKAFATAMTTTRESMGITKEDELPEIPDPPREKTPQERVHAREAQKREERYARLGRTPPDRDATRATRATREKVEDAFADEAPEPLPPRPTAVEEIPDLKIPDSDFDLPTPLPPKPKPVDEVPDFEIPDIDFDLPDSPRPTAVGTGAAIPDYLPTPTDFSILEEMKRDGVGVDKTQLEELPDVAIPARRDVTTGLGEASPSPSDKPSNSAKPREASPSPSDTQELPVVKVASSETPSQRPPTSSTSNVEWDKEWVEDIIGGPPIPDAPKYPKSARPGHGSFQLDDELGESKRATERESEQLSSNQLVTDMQEMQDSIMRTENGTKSLNFELLRQLVIDNNNDDRRLRELVYAFQNSRTTLSDVNI